MTLFGFINQRASKEVVPRLVMQSNVGFHVLPVTNENDSQRQCGGVGLGDLHFSALRLMPYL
jgi:hypothetical protein